MAKNIDQQTKGRKSDSEILRCISSMQPLAGHKSPGSPL